MTGTINAHTPGSGTVFLGFFNNGNGGYPQNNSLGLYLDGQNTFTNVYMRAVTGTASMPAHGRIPPSPLIPT